MSNLGLEKALAGKALSSRRTPVGDKYVLEEMLGEGRSAWRRTIGAYHFLRFRDNRGRYSYSTELLETLRDSGKTLTELVKPVKTFPQKLVNVRVQRKRPLEELPAVQDEIRNAEKEFAGSRPGAGPVFRNRTSGAGDD